MDKKNKIYIAGHQGMVGSALVRKLKKEGYRNLLFKSSSELDLRNQQVVDNFFALEKPDYVFLAAAKVGGIHATNTYKAEFIYDNLMIATNVIHASYLYKVKKLLFLSSSSVYPKLVTQPIKESTLLTGKLEPTNESFAIAKITGIKLCEAYRDQYDCNFISAIATNLYGPNKNHDLKNQHVISTFISIFNEAKIKKKPFVEIWGSGMQRREFMHVEDMADASLFLMCEYNNTEFVNIGTGEEISILALARIIKDIVGYEGTIKPNLSKPEGAPRKLLDTNKLLKLGWKPTITLETGIQQVQSFFNQYNN